MAEDKDAWQIDVLEITLDDMEVLQAGFAADMDISKLKEALDRLVVNKTIDDIGKLTLRQLNDHLDAALGEIEELAVPKQNGTPS